MANSTKATTVGEFLDHHIVEGGIDPKSGEEIADKHEFFFKAKEGLVSIAIRSAKYLTALYDRYEVSDMKGLVEKMKAGPVDLFFENNNDYVGFALMPSYQSNNFPHKRNSRVRINNVSFSDNGICFELADGTVANRSFSTRVNDEWYPDIQKKMRFVKNLPMPEGMELSLVDPDFNSLVGMLMTYQIKEFNKSRFLDPVNIERGDVEHEDTASVSLD